MTIQGIAFADLTAEALLHYAVATHEGGWGAGYKSCGRPYATPCEHEHVCIRCPILQVDPVMIGRLDEINEDLITRRVLAETKGWLGELEDIDLTHRFLQGKRHEEKRPVELEPLKDHVVKTTTRSEFALLALICAGYSSTTPASPSPWHEDNV